MQRYFGNVIHGLIHSRHTGRIVRLLVIVSLLLPSLRGAAMRTVTAYSPSATVSSQVIVDDTGNNTTPSNHPAGLQITLSEGSEQPAATTPMTVAAATPLSADAVQALLDRLPPLETAATDQQEFRLPTEVLPPPRPGATITETFPMTAAVAPDTEVTNGPLEV